MAVPNVSEGRDSLTVRAISDAFCTDRAVRLLDVHSDADHHRSVYTLAGPPRALSDALMRGASEAVSRIDVICRLGRPRVARRASSCRRARRRARRLPRRRPPVAPRSPRRSYWPTGSATSCRFPSSYTVSLPAVAPARSCAPAGSPGSWSASPLASCAPTSVLPHLHPSAGATLVSARAPLVAFNLRLASPATVARRAPHRLPDP